MLLFFMAFRSILGKSRLLMDGDRLTGVDTLGMPSCRSGTRNETPMAKDFPVRQFRTQALGRSIDQLHSGGPDE